MPAEKGRTCCVWRFSLNVIISRSGWNHLAVHFCWKTATPVPVQSASVRIVKMVRRATNRWQPYFRYISRRLDMKRISNDEGRMNVFYRFYKRLRNAIQPFVIQYSAVRFSPAAIRYSVDRMSYHHAVGTAIPSQVTGWRVYVIQRSSGPGFEVQGWKLPTSSSQRYSAFVCQ